MKFLILCMIALLCTAAIAQDSWTFKPSVYARGGVSMKSNMTQRISNKNVLNLGIWSEESNAVSNPLTEVTIEAKKGDEVKLVYGIDVDNNTRHVDGSTTSGALRERLAYIEFYQGPRSLWFGNRAYRGDGDYLARNFVLDEHNMLGGGIRLENFIGKWHTELAYGVKEHTDPFGDDNQTTAPYVINLYINKWERPLATGKFKVNLELHDVNPKIRKVNESSNSYAHMIGAQFQDWGAKIFGANWYNMLVVNYSRGFIYGGSMKSAFNDANKDNKPSKYLVKWAGDIKKGNKGIYYSNQMQRHMGKGQDKRIVFWDVNVRPVMGITEHLSTGIDLAQRFVSESPNCVDYEWACYQTNGRYSLMLAYNLKDQPFDTPVLSMFVGHMKRRGSTEFTSGSAKKKHENFIRLNYEISI